MAHTENDRALALAGVFQACKLVQSMATTGATESAPMEATIGSLFALDSDSVTAIYNGSRGVDSGLHTLMAQVGQRGGARDIEITRYAINLLQLEKQLSRRDDLLTTIHDRIAVLQGELAHHQPTDTSLISELAAIYSDTISGLKPRILVNGEPMYLNNESCANTIRALLLAGIRSVVLWRQLGGNRWVLLLRSKAILHSAEELLAQIQNQ